MALLRIGKAQNIHIFKQSFSIKNQTIDWQIPPCFSYIWSIFSVRNKFYFLAEYHNLQL